MAKHSKDQESSLETISQSIAESLRLIVEPSQSVARALQPMIQRSEQLAKLSSFTIGAIQPRVASGVAREVEAFSRAALPTAIGTLQSTLKQQEHKIAGLGSGQFSPLSLRLSEIAALVEKNYSFAVAASAVVDSRSSSIRQALYSLNPARSLRSIVSANRCWADLFPQFSAVSAIADLQSSKLSDIDESLGRSAIEESGKSFERMMNRSFAPSLTDAVSTVTSLHSSTWQQALDKLIDPSQSIARFLSYRQNWFAAAQRQTIQPERALSQESIINKTVLEPNFMPLQSNESSTILKADIQASEARLRADISEFKAEMRADIACLLQAQLLVPQAIESHNPDAFLDSSSWRLLAQIEVHLRKVIEQRLTELSGSKWIKQRVPFEMRKHWEKRQEGDRGAGRTVYDLILYAHFMDLLNLIVKEDNWRDVFESIFKNKDEVRISLERLHPIRNSIAHNRPLSKSDKLTLVSEANQIFSALGLDFSLEVGSVYLHLH